MPKTRNGNPRRKRNLGKKRANNRVKQFMKKLVSNLFHSLIFLCLPAILTACASVPLMSLPKLMALDLETLDIDKIELAVRLDDTLGIRQNGSQLFIEVENEKTNTALQHSLILNVREENLTPFLKRKAKPGYKIHRFKLTSEQASKAEKFRKDALTLRDKSGKDLKTQLTAAAQFCQVEKGTEFEGAALTFYVRTNPKKDFYTLFKEQNIRVSSEAKAELESSPPVYCK